MNDLEKYFYKSQIDWIDDDSPLKLAVKSRQTGFSYANAFRLVALVSAKNARLDAFISSRDQFQARLQLEDCLRWGKLLDAGLPERHHPQRSRVPQRRRPRALDVRPRWPWSRGNARFPPPQVIRAGKNGCFRLWFRPS